MISNPIADVFQQYKNNLNRLADELKKIDNKDKLNTGVLYSLLITKHKIRENINLAHVFIPYIEINILANYILKSFLNAHKSIDEYINLTTKDDVFIENLLMVNHANRAKEHSINSYLINELIKKNYTFKSIETYEKMKLKYNIKQEHLERLDLNVLLSNNNNITFQELCSLSTNIISINEINID